MVCSSGARGPLQVTTVVSQSKSAWAVQIHDGASGRGIEINHVVIIFLPWSQDRAVASSVPMLTCDVRDNEVLSGVSADGSAHLVEVPPLPVLCVVASCKSQFVLVISDVAISVPLKALISLLDSKVGSGGSWEIWVLVGRISHVVNVSVLNQRLAGLSLASWAISAIAFSFVNLGIVISVAFHGDVLLQVFIAHHAVGEVVVFLSVVETISLHRNVLTEVLIANHSVGKEI